MNQNRQAFLEVIAHSEIGEELLNLSDNGYNVLVGSTPQSPKLFTSYADHPNILVTLSPTLQSTAAGRYQILHRYFVVYKQQLNLPDFGDNSQDKIALQMISECNAFGMIDEGRIADAIRACSTRWASLPGATYGQHVNNLADLLAVYTKSGGVLAT